MRSKYSWMLLPALMGSLNAEENGIFLEGGYQQGKAQYSTNKNGKNATTANLKGFGLQIGYQMFANKYFGFKVYGFFDYAHTQGIEFANKNASGNPINCQMPGGGLPGGAIPPLPGGVRPPAGVPGGVGMPQCSVNVMGILQQVVGSNKPVQPNMLTYGGGVDLIVNVLSSKMIALGVIGGIQLAGNSWILATPNITDVAMKYMDVSKKATGFQFLFNVGGRLRILKHSSIEAGIKFPMLRNNPFLQTKNDGTVYLRRLYSWYVNYAFTF
ncbi:outer membrane protein [Helicobacter heilmannii]|uniref:Outer membrane protein (Omp30) n=1 Tax=Helicobacter heilmannii TaxID=35817 RepID=A0A0K2Y8T5_HELHE|nr:outer membrane protein [Helicobacter heilmannii]BDQ27325.1 membrane protein [Helicobacter heilmannii]CCM12268.1 outer membrane protein (omp30) [Helicobacter heilmannii ASB1.4]CCM73351.1 outer membrane protein (omp30) [Helicobacter heilmannii ASB1.4]CRI34104.1 outer membrane protein (omp30) [Helicobacter heilmannii]